MPLKNYTTKVPANRSIQEIQDSLVKHGASGFAMEYEQGTGRIKALSFMLELEQNTIPFRLPVDWRQFQAVLKQQRITRWDDEDYCYRVTWRILRDWIMAQMALYETKMVSIPQIFLPYAVTNNGQTMFERIASNPQMLLTSSKD